MYECMFLSQQAKHVQNQMDKEEHTIPIGKLLQNFLVSKYFIQRLTLMEILSLPTLQGCVKS